MIKYQAFELSYIDELLDIWNTEVAGVEIYAELSKDEFMSKFINNPHYDPKGSIMALDGKKLVGFGNAIFYKGQDPETSPGFISMLVVKKEYRRQGIATNLLKIMEDFIKNTGHKFMRNYFGSPINLKWYVPGYDHHEHMGCPAVPFNTSYYFFLLANGYNVNGQHDGYHANLANYELTDEIKAKIAENEKDGYYISYYDENKHSGWDEFFDALGNEGFRRSVYNTLKTPNKNKLVIVSKDGKVVGFTGPVKTEASKRSSLSGVAIHPGHQKRGLGKTMFCKFCEFSKENGGEYMTLFTGSDNRARNIYLYAGLRVVMSFVVMRKDFK